MSEMTEWRCADEAWDSDPGLWGCLLFTSGDWKRKNGGCREAGKGHFWGILPSRHSAAIRSRRGHAAQLLVSAGLQRLLRNYKERPRLRHGLLGRGYQPTGESAGWRTQPAGSQGWIGGCGQGQACRGQDTAGAGLYFGHRELLQGLGETRLPRARSGV